MRGRLLRRPLLNYFFGVGLAAGVGVAAGLFSGDAAGAGALSLIDINSTSKISVELGPMGPPGVPRGP